MAKIKITLERSLIAKEKKHQKIAWSLGLRKRGDSNTVTQSNAIKGMIAQIGFMVKVEEVK